MISGIICEDCGKIMFYKSLQKHKKTGSCERVQARNKRNNVIMIHKMSISYIDKTNVRKSI